MKIKEIIESEGSIKTYWLLQSIDIDRYYQIYLSLSKVTATTDEQKMLIKSNYVQLYSLIDALLRNLNWQYLESDPDYEKVYSSLLDMHGGISKYLTTYKT
jgi:hypothetical protein